MDFVKVRNVVERPVEDVPVEGIDHSDATHVLRPGMRPLEGVVGRLFANDQFQGVIARIAFVKGAPDGRAEGLEGPARIQGARPCCRLVQIPA
jgi:hypothetical protein